MEDDKLFTGLELNIQGHLRIFEYQNREALKQGNYSILLNRRNAIHKDNVAIMAIKSITNSQDGQIAYMFFGNGGTLIDSFGSVSFNPPNDTGINGDLYNPVYFQLVDDRLGSLAGNAMAVRHMSGSFFSDVEIRCLINVNQPFGQPTTNTLPTITEPTTILNINDAQFSFDEIGLKLADGTLVTHVIFVPIVKTASSLLEIIYTLRVAVPN